MSKDCIFIFGLLNYGLMIFSALSVTVTSAPPTTKPPVQNQFKIQHYSKKCFKYESSDQRIHLSSSCDDLYYFSSTKSLVHSATGKCLKPISNSDNTPFTLTSTCDDNTRFDQTPFGSLKQIKTGSCIHPLNGALHPAEGQLVVIYRGCDETRLKFSLGNPEIYDNVLFYI